MKKKIFLFSLCVVLIATCILCGTTGIIRNDSQSQPKTQTADTAATENPASPSMANSLTLKVGETEIVQLSAKKAKSVVKWTSSDSKIVTVDDGGRVDALKEGTALISAISKDKSKSEFQITVTKSTAKKQNSYSTCITANADKLEQNRRNKAKNLYAIKVNRTANCVTVYTYDEKGKYTVPVRAMVCSTGLNNATITGDYTIGIKTEWLFLVGDVFGRYISGISGDYLFHSVPYYTLNEQDLEVEEFNKLGEQASQGCVRLAVSDAKWIYDNCPTGTAVNIYDDVETAGPLGKPDTIKITDFTNKWDPTDSNKKCPYAKATPIISGANDCTIKTGGNFYALAGVTAVDTCGNDISSEIKVVGNVVTTRKGKYKVTYSVTDVLKRTSSVTITVTVQ
ncbi:L,D-transpeptidase family protein [Ruminococcus bromii]|uniref:L,D-transpeptidase family protein n=1 Tax=Ruminococcus bromii TaxID=40518 RepID=UPI0026EEE970|nr:L,D-transpeptidase family protein [Ruminococcus bromii]